MGSFVKPEDLEKENKPMSIEEFTKKTDEESTQEDLIIHKLNSIENEIIILKINQQKILGRLREVKDDLEHIRKG